MFPSGKSDDAELVGYSHSGLCGDRVEKRSTTRYLFKYLGAPISWCSKKQSMIALSIYKAEYIVDALSSCLTDDFSAGTKVQNE